MNHTITQTGQVCQCDACGWRCILTTQGPFIRDAGDPAIDHLAAQQAQRAERQAYVEQLLTRMRRQHTDRRAIFWELYRVAREEGDEKSITAFGGQRDDGTLTLAQLRQLYNCIITEHEL